MSGSYRAALEEGRANYTGWVAGAIVIFAVLAVGVGFWFMHHL